MAKLADVWWAMPPTAFLDLAFMLTYLWTRVAYIAQAYHDENTSLRSIAFAWLFFALEALLLLPHALALVLRTFALRPAVRHQRRLQGDDVPTVDVLIVTCNENLDVVMDTTRAACALDYPADRFRVIVSDDGDSAILRAAIEALAKDHSNLFYTARVIGPVNYYKAGNLNHGLRFSGTISSSGDSECKAARSNTYALKYEGMSTATSKTTTLRQRPYPSQSHLEKGTRAWGEYVAGIDADMIPEPYWLRATLPHLIEEPSMALVCPPQTFYDIPPNDPLTQKMSQFAGVSEVVKDALGHADCLGSGYVLRRAAIDHISGFPVKSIAEDFIGHLQTFGLFKFRLGSRGRYLTFRQRVAGIAFDLRQMVQVPLAVTYLIMPIVLLSGSSLVFWQTPDQLRFLIRLVSIWAICHWVHGGVMGIIAWIGNDFYDVRITSYDTEMEQWLSPYIFLAFMQSFVLPKALGGSPMGFDPSGSVKSELHERDALQRAPLSRRLRVTLFSHLVIVHVLFLLTCLIGVGLILVRAFSSTQIADAYSPVELHSTMDRVTFLVTRLGWPPLFWLRYISSTSLPLLYCIWPPTQPDRETLLDRDEKTSVAYPKPGNRMWKVSGWGNLQYARATFAITCTLVLFVANGVVDFRL